MVRWVALHGTEIAYMAAEPTDNTKDMVITKSQILPSTVINRDDIEVSRHHPTASPTPSPAYALCYAGPPPRIRNSHQRRQHASVVSARRVHSRKEVLAHAAGTRAGDHKVAR